MLMNLQLILALLINHELKVNGTATVLTIVLDVLRPTGKLKIFSFIFRLFFSQSLYSRFAFDVDQDAG